MNAFGGLVLFLFTIISTTTNGQSKVLFSVLLDSMAIETDSIYRIDSVIIIDNLRGSGNWQIENFKKILQDDYDSTNYGWRLPDNSSIMCKRPVVISNTRFEQGHSGFFPSIVFEKSLQIINSFNTGPSLNFARSEFHGDFDIKGTKNLLFHKCKFRNDLFIELPEKGAINIVNCTFHPYFSKDDDWPHLYLSYLTLRGQEVEFVQIAGCQFEKTNHPGLIDLENLSVQNFYFLKNNCYAKVFMQRTMIWAMLNIRENNFYDHFIVNSCKFPTDNFFFPFEQIDSTISSAKEQGEAITLNDSIMAINNIDQKKTAAIPLLSEALSRLYISYKISGDDNGANKTFLLQKNLQLIEKRANLDAHFSTATFFGYYINRFIGWYSDFGTNIVKCFIRTFELIILFSLIYLVDVYIGNFAIPFHYLKLGTKLSGLGWYSRIMMIEAVPAGIKKKLRWKPSPPIKSKRWTYVNAFSYYLVYNIFHALLLSINAFLTLGYGELTANKRLRFVYVLEGVLGWFLISFLTACILAETIQ